MSEYILELKGITKIFPGVKALNNVQFQLKPGEVHALMGENGAGKSTFIKVITGVHKAEEGEMFLNGEKVDFKGPRDAQAAGIAAVYQHPTSYPHLTVAENIFMGHEIINLFKADNEIEVDGVKYQNFIYLNPYGNFSSAYTGRVKDMLMVISVPKKNMFEVVGKATDLVDIFTPVTGFNAKLDDKIPPQKQIA